MNIISDGVRDVVIGGTHSTDGECEVHTKFYSGNQKARDNLSNLDVDGRGILKWTFQKCDVKFFAGFKSFVNTFMIQRFAKKAGQFFFTP